MVLEHLCRNQISRLNSPGAMALDGQVGIVWHGMVMVHCTRYRYSGRVMVQRGMASLVSLAGLGVKTAQRRSVPILMLISQLSSHRHTAQKIQIQTRSNIPYLALYEPVQ